MTKDLWHHHCGDATGSYRVVLCFFLEEKCFDVLLANAKNVKNVSGKKTDEADAEWIMLIHGCGLLKPSFHPDAAARSIRELARHRAISFDAEKHAFSMWGVNAMEMLGMSLGALAVLMGNLEADSQKISRRPRAFASGATSFRTTKSQVANFSRARCRSRRIESDRCSDYVPTQ